MKQKKRSKKKAGASSPARAPKTKSSKSIYPEPHNLYTDEHSLQQFKQVSDKRHIDLLKLLKEIYGK